MGMFFSLPKSWRVAAFLVLAVAPAMGMKAQEVLDEADVHGGVLVYLGCDEPRLLIDLGQAGSFVVHGLDTKKSAIEEARRKILGAGQYGPVSVDLWEGKHLPYGDNLVNLIVVPDKSKVSEREMLRALAPRGVILTLKRGAWDRRVKPWPEELDEWTHYLHGPDGNPVADDDAVGLPRHLQWVAGPPWARHHDHSASMTSLVSAQGRLFYIFDEGSTASIQLPAQWKLIARDGFNGVLLWKRDLDAWNTHHYPLKSGPTELLRRLVAVEDRVYVTLGIDEPASSLDALTGETVQTYKGSEFTKEIVVSDGTVFLVVGKSKSRLPDFRRRSTYVWDNTRRANPDWGWQGDVGKILVYDAVSGKALWSAERPVATCSLAVDGSHVVFHDGRKLVCLDRSDGETQWEGEAMPVDLPVHTDTGPRIVLHENVVVLANNKGIISGWSGEDGRKLWEVKHKPSGHHSLKDLIIMDKLVWTGAIASKEHDGAFSGYDPVSGELKKEFPADVKVHWFHHRCYPSKAAGDFILTARNGTEYVSLTEEHWTPNHWVRGGCTYGVMPCNGMTYAPMHACGCQLEAKLMGFNALASIQTDLPPPPSSRLLKGPAYSHSPGPRASGSASSPSSLPSSEIPVPSSDWPTYRHDASRSGSTTAQVGHALKGAWTTKIGGRLTAPIMADGKVFVAAKDEHTVHALDAKNGERLWSHTVGGRVDSPPTHHKGLIIFGSMDGSIYALRASDGDLVWRFRAAPVDRRLMAYDQLESVWPVHGSVLIHDDVLYCTAGRNMYLDGGLRFLRLDPISGNLLGETIMDDKDPETGEDMHTAYLKKTEGNVMPVALPDILSCDGRNIWMRSQKINFQGKRLEIGLKPVKDQNPEDFHLFCQIGFLDDSYFFRSYWTYGRRVSGGYGGWYQAGRLVPSGRILCHDDERVYGFGRKPSYMVNASVLEYRLFSADKLVTEEAIAHVSSMNNAINARSERKNANASDWRTRYFFPEKDLSAVQYDWLLEQPSIIARAMVATGDTLFAAGPPDLVDERKAFHHPDDPEIQTRLAQQRDALEGAQGAELWALSKDDGKVLARYAMDALPVFNSLAATEGRLFLTTADGRVLCLSEAGEKPLRSVDDRPIQILWDEPEDPGYLLPLEESKESDFGSVTDCKVTNSKLGYRIRAEKRETIGAVLNRVDPPATQTLTLKTKLKKSPNNKGLLSNGFLAFGSGPEKENLIKCGVKLQAKEAMIIQGPFKGGTRKQAKYTPPDRAFEMEATIDLKAGTITFTVGEVVLEAELKTPMDKVTHMGYVVEGASVDVAPIEVVGER